jgi:biotin carboxyl carrier protein
VISIFEGLELYDGKLSRTVLRGERAVRPLPTRWLREKIESVMSFLSNLLNGALGQPSSLEFEQMSPEDEVFPNDGFIRAPSMAKETTMPSEGLYFGPEFTTLVASGSVIVGGQPVAEIETSQLVVEVVSPCSGVVEEVLLSNGVVVESKQPLIKIGRP